MRAVHRFEETRMMHQSVRPIEIRVVHDQHHTDARPEPDPTIVIYPSVHERPTRDDCKDHPAVHNCEDRDGPHRLQEFPPDLTLLEIELADASMRKPSLHEITDK